MSQVVSQNKKQNLDCYRRCSYLIHSKMSAVLGYLDLVKELTRAGEIKEVVIYLGLIENLCKEIIKDFDNSINLYLHQKS